MTKLRWSFGFSLAFQLWLVALSLVLCSPTLPCSSKRLEALSKILSAREGRRLSDGLFVHLAIEAITDSMTDIEEVWRPHPELFKFYMGVCNNMKIALGDGDSKAEREIEALKDKGEYAGGSSALQRSHGNEIELQG
ncbi:hypothetical protein IE53DRAFT_388906 [Violaceomyces palustris]|uniref:Uncharacterized protein n=1 Tax=Violaceomyces palustris TaxID=1673888 RepID=A0ACD0NSV2_9BASI|nr:hypothetical protein IE53DRAFT_388906 [Violaceomyces palustris]